MNSPTKSKNFFPSTSSVSKGKERKARFRVGWRETAEEFHRLKSLEFLEIPLEPLLAKSFNIGFPSVTVFRIERTRRRPSVRSARWWTVYDGQDPASNLFSKACSRKAHTPSFPSPWRGERERDIIGILGVRLPWRLPFPSPSLFPFPPVRGLSTPCQRFRAFVVGDGPLTDSIPVQQ